jgi:hypothetical protein
MLISFSELRKVDVMPFCDFREAKDDNGKTIKVPYLNWARCKDLLHKNGAEIVYFEPCVNEKGSSLFMSNVVFTDSKGNTNRCYEVRVKITIDEVTFEAQFPLMNGSNPVKDNSLTQQRVWNAQTRAFVKGVAMRTGLGFDLWLDDEDSKSTEDDLNKHNLKSIEERVQQTYTRLIRKGMTTNEIAQALNKTPDEVKTIFTFFAQLDRFEQDLTKLL